MTQPGLEEGQGGVDSGGRQQALARAQQWSRSTHWSRRALGAGTPEQPCRPPALAGDSRTLVHAEEGAQRLGRRGEASGMAGKGQGQVPQCMVWDGGGSL